MRAKSRMRAEREQPDTDASPGAQEKPTTCPVCQTEAVHEVLDVGMHPISNRFLVDPTAEEYRHSVVLGLCGCCGLVQMVEPVPVAELVSPFEWITYNEPEGHLDAVVDVIAALPGVDTRATVVGLSYKEDSTLARLRARGFVHTWRLDPRSDLGIVDPRAGLETIQDRLRPEVAVALGQKHGGADVLIARHILEHAHNMPRFVAAMHALVKPGGYVVVEVPDCTRVLEACDYTTIWEEHILYFTRETFRTTLAYGGFSVVRFDCYPYPYENSLVAVVQPRRGHRAHAPPVAALDVERQRALLFARSLEERRRAVSMFLDDYARHGGKVAVFGAGHLASMFINLMGVKNAIAFVVDDHPQKRGLFMPGSRLPIRGSEALITENIRLCLSSLSPESEEKVIRKNRGFVERGGTFASIFPGTENSLGV